MLPDLLAPGLRLVICSMSAKDKGAAAEQYYAEKGNRLWDTLRTVGLTPRELAPAEWQQLLEYRIGLVDLVPRDNTGMERGVRFEGATELRRKIREFQPGMLVFNGKAAAKEYFGMATVVYGLLPNSIGTTKLFVCPSTSGGSKSNWDPRWWDVMSKLA